MSFGLVLIVIIRTRLRDASSTSPWRLSSPRVLQPFEVGQVAERLHAKDGEKVLRRPENRLELRGEIPLIWLRQQRGRQAKLGAIRCDRPLDRAGSIGGIGWGRG